MTVVTALWWAVIFSGVYHGANPGMGWPLAVSAALMEQRHGALMRALGWLAVGHFAAMVVVLVPFSLLAGLAGWLTEVRVAAGLIVMAMGVYLLINRRHPKLLARVHPARLALWSFLAAMAHGAGLMLVPFFLGMEGAHAGHAMPAVGTALWVAVVHTLAMVIAGGVIAVVIYVWLGLKFLSRTWFNLDLVWALSLVLVGAFGVYAALAGH